VVRRRKKLSLGGTGRRRRARRAPSPGREKHGQRPRRREIDDWNELGEKRRNERPMPSDKRDHRDPNGHVERIIEDGNCTSREKRQEPELNGVCDDGHDSSRKDASPCLFHGSTLTVERGTVNARRLKSCGATDRQSRVASPISSPARTLTPLTEEMNSNVSGTQLASAGGAGS
jgi:hypothetical protein